MRKTGISLAILSGMLLWAILMGGVRENAGDILARYQRVSPFSPREMTYRSVQRTMLGEGIVLYQPIFPGLPIQFRADKVSIKKTGGEMILRFFDVKIDIAETLRRRDGQRLADVFRRFNPPDDFFLKPLEALALIHKDVVKGNMELRLRPQGKNTAIGMKWEQNGHLVAVIDTVIWDVPDNRLWGWTEGKIQSAEIQIVQPTLLRAVAGYYKALSQPVPVSLKEAIDGEQTLSVRVTLPRFIPVSSLLSQQ